MEEQKIASFPRPVYGRIPNFKGADRAAENLRNLPEYKVAKAVFCNPDSPQKPVREMVLKDGKTLVMATPKLKHGFLQIDPAKIPANRVSEASSIHGAFQYGRTVKPDEVKIDLFIAGSVAVAPDGVRVGKGTGYSDQEYALLRDAGAFSSKTSIVTTVHDVQIVDHISRDEWDIPVDVIVTPTRTIRTKKL